MGRKSENGSLWGGKKKTRVSFSLRPPLLGAKVLLELLGLFFFYLNLPFFPLLSQSFPQIKSKLKNEGSVGLYTYPVLQAADILLYK